jgi:hypothetical protein
LKVPKDRSSVIPLTEQSPAASNSSLTTAQIGFLPSAERRRRVENSEMLVKFQFLKIKLI